MFFSRGLKNDNFSPLLKACFKALGAIKDSLKQGEPQELSGVLRQPLFGNPLILEGEEKPLGMGPNVGMHLWAQGGINKVEHLWDESSQDWRSMTQIQAILPRRRSVMENGRVRRRKAISHIPWDPRAFWKD